MPFLPCVGASSSGRGVVCLITWGRGLMLTKSTLLLRYISRTMDSIIEVQTEVSKLKFWIFNRQKTWISTLNFVDHAVSQCNQRKTADSPRFETLDESFQSFRVSRGLLIRFYRMQVDKKFVSSSRLRAGFSGFIGFRGIPMALQLPEGLDFDRLRLYILTAETRSGYFLSDRLDISYHHLPSSYIAVVYS